jgi:hypothetical protein
MRASWEKRLAEADVRVTGEVAQHLLGSGERRLAVDHPLGVPQWGDEALERAPVGKPGMRVEEPQLAGGRGRSRRGQWLKPASALGSSR